MIAKEARKVKGELSESFRYNIETATLPSGTGEGRVVEPHAYNKDRGVRCTF